ncbi:hypothetical protein BDV28DRAFT_126979 [Aspergillus coremiiformis]|uniref:Uncharacterized protein n=1 Tax=Aspergillus coremiiformis TaxID=138285 RepID=A0A5N6ZFQ1_9EURO|nr:hypothetical protein BDV28DRAFT_126979 [Aspergillus coremiiformis]
MFDLPNAKRVRRDELVSPSSSRSSSPQREDTLTSGYERLGELLNLPDFLIQPEQQLEQIDAQQTNTGHEEEEEQEFEFRLFSAPAPDPTAPTTQDGDAAATGSTGQKNEGNGAGTQKLRIRLRSPTPGTGGPDGRLVNPFRGWEYYFSAPGLLSGSKEHDPKLVLRRKQFEEVAISGEQMREWARVPWPGCHLPWRVIHLKRHQTKLPRGSEDTTTAVFVAEPQARHPKSRKKPGKKRRLQLRKHLAAVDRAKETEAEKRNRKNRERKIKRRQKAREMKATVAAAATPKQSQDAPAVEGDDASSQEGSN